MNRLESLRERKQTDWQLLDVFIPVIHLAAPESNSRAVEKPLQLNHITVLVLSRSNGLDSFWQVYVFLLESFSRSFAAAALQIPHCLDCIMGVLNRGVLPGSELNPG
ncbi:MAG TPA: hypothetical protein VFK88_08415 [Gallionella sp.]|nr:hypothetical protein [Gallionella sp.]